MKTISPIYTKVCKVCRKEYKKSITQSVNNFINRSKYCSRECLVKGQQGKHPWNKGLTLETDSRLSQYWLGRKHTTETLEKITKANRLNAKKKPKSFFQEMQKKAVEVGIRNHSHKGRPGVIADKHEAWKGNDASYTSKHKWILKHWIKTGICQKCGAVPIPKGRLKHGTQWHNIDHEYDRDNKDTWVELCPKCHRKEDKLWQIQDNMIS